MQDNEIPPREIWLFSSKVADHFKNLKAKKDREHAEEAPEGSYDDAQSGSNVTMRNAWATELLGMQDRQSYDDFTTV